MLKQVVKSKMNLNDDSIDFLGIGVQKSASSWLWALLKEHDDIWMPPRKEIHYFDRSLSYPSPSFLASDNLFDRLNGLEAHNALFRKKLENELGSRINRNDYKDILWYSNYFFGTYNDDWYKSLFAEGVGKVRGEITPAYSILHRKDIEHIHRLFPNLKIILILRNPIERAWSQARFYMTRNKFNVGSNLSEMKEFIDSDIQTTRGNYIKIMNNWLSVFSQQKFFIGFYDEIIHNKEVFISKICDFLEITPNNLIKSDVLTQKINVSIEMKIPKEIEEYLVVKYLEDIKYLSKVLGFYPKQWLKAISTV